LSRFALTLAAFALALAGCGGGDRPGRTVTVPSNATVRVVAKEYSFDPSRIVVRGPGIVRFTLENDGSLAHNLKLSRDGREVGGTPAFSSGQKKSVRLTLSRGDYDFVCTVGDHEELGMKGTLSVD
jgi:plastocyanin